VASNSPVTLVKPALIHSAAPKGGVAAETNSAPYHFRDRSREIRLRPTVHQLRPRACVLLRVDHLMLGHPMESSPNGLKGTVEGPIPE
jgi:hypothetical protein